MIETERPKCVIKGRTLFHIGCGGQIKPDALHVASVTEDGRRYFTEQLINGACGKCLKQGMFKLI